MSYQSFGLKIENDIAHIVLNKPEKRNSLAAGFWRDLPIAVRDIDENSLARVIVISSTGPVFCAGIDVSMLADMAGESEKNNPAYGAAILGKVEFLPEKFNRLENWRLAGLAAVAGGCYGPGWDMTTGFE